MNEKRKAVVAAGIIGGAVIASLAACGKLVKNKIKSLREATDETVEYELIEED